MRLLELCCGENKSVSVVAQEMGWEVVTLDWNSKCGPDLCMDVRDFDPSAHGHFNVVWASPDCREISQNRQGLPGNLEFSDSVSKKCL